MVLPEIIGLLVFLFIPILYAVYISAFDWDVLSEKTFVGFQNYQNMLKDEMFFRSIWITLRYSIIYVVLVFVLSLIMAVFVQSLRNKYLQQTARIAIYLPNTISTIVAATVWIFLFEARNGYLNRWLTAVGIGRQDFLGSTSQALICVVVVGVWLVVGYDMIIFLSALKDVPESYYEAARLDGANCIQQFFKITFPLIKDTSVFIAITTIIGSFQVFDQIRVMTNGGPGGSTTVTVFYIYQLAFEKYQFGYASTIAVTLSILIMFVTLFQLKLYKIDD